MIVPKEIKQCRGDKPEYIIYRVKEQYKYWFNDADPVIVKRGLTYFNAMQLCAKLDMADDVPKNPSGCPQRLHKVCHESDWPKEENLFKGGE